MDTKTSKASSFPPVALALVILSFLVSIPVLTLSGYNYGFFSVIINRFVTALTILVHLCIIASSWEQRQIPDGCPPSVIPRTLPTIYRSRIAIILMLLCVLNLMAFGMIAQITVEGPESLLPAERAPNMTPTWNLPIQIAQSSLLGVQSLLLAVLASVAVVGRIRFMSAEKDAREAKECGLESVTSFAGETKV